MLETESTGEPTPLDQVEEMIKDILKSQQAGINMPELDDQLAGLILRRDDLIAK